MRMMAACGENWEIGNKGNLLVKIPLDQQYFREDTLHKTVIMGRKTLESLPGGRPLSDRKNIVLTRNLMYQAPEGVTLCYYPSQVEKLYEKHLSSGGSPDDFIVIGGGQIYEMMLPYCDYVDLTYIRRSFDADTFFPDLSKNPDWTLVGETDEETYFDLCYTFRLYARKSALEGTRS